MSISLSGLLVFWPQILFLNFPRKVNDILWIFFCFWEGIHMKLFMRESNYI